MQPNHQEDIQKSIIQTSRIQLKGYGLTRYQAIKITQPLTPISRQGRTYIYSINDVISSIRNTLSNPRIKPQTKNQLTTLLTSLLERLGNVIPLPFNLGKSSHPEIGELTKQLLRAISVTDQNLAELKATAANINSKYHK